MIKKRTLLTWGYVIGAGWFVAVSHAHGEVVNYAAEAKAEETQYKTPEDLLNKVPVLGDIPRVYSVGSEYTMKLSGLSLRVDHMAGGVRHSSQNRTCMFGLSFTAPTAFFTTQVDIPLFSSPTLALSDWKANSLGDYELNMSKSQIDSSTLMLSFRARF